MKRSARYWAARIGVGILVSGLAYAIGLEVWVCLAVGFGLAAGISLMIENAPTRS